jgi:hypothetical protein
LGKAGGLEHGDEEEHGAVGRRTAHQGRDPLTQFCSDPLHFLKPDLLSKVFVPEDAEMIEIKREAEIVLRQYDSPIWPQRMANAELIYSVNVCGGEVGNDQICREQIVVHRFVDDAGMDDLVRADAAMAGPCDNRLDDVFVGSIQV